MMTPDDDPTWPVCADMCAGYQDGKWCGHLRVYFLEGRDAPNVNLGTRLCVPVFPVLRVFAEVSIDTEEIMPGSARLALVKSEMFTSDETLIPLGLWSKPEGRMSMSSTIQDWLRSMPELQCQNRGHGFREEQLLAQKQYDGNVVQWFLNMHEMCPPCYDKTRSFASGMINGISGADPDNTNNPAMQRLQQHVGSRSRVIP